LRGKRYREPSRYGTPSKRILLRILITVISSLLVSVLFCFFGIMLGRNADEGTVTTPDGESVTSSPKEEITTEPQFVFKDVENVKAVPIPVGKGDLIPYNTVRVPITDGEGKLAYLSSVSSLMYGSEFSTTLKPIAAAVNGADLKSNEISVSLLPFILENNQDFADDCTLALVKELCGYNIDEILFERCDISEDLLLRSTAYTGTKENVKLGVLLPSSVFDGIISEKEQIVREYYTAYDFCVIDLSDITLGKASETGIPADTGSSSPDGETASPEEEKPSPSAYDTLYAEISENALLIAKYSLRIRLCATEDGLEEALRLIEALGVENYEIVTE